MFLNAFEELSLLYELFWFESIFTEFSFADTNWFSNSARGHDYPKFLLLNDLKDTSRGFLINDTLIIEAQIEIISTVKIFTEKK